MNVKAGLCSKETKHNIRIGSEPEDKDKEEGRTNACNKKATWKE